VIWRFGDCELDEERYQLRRRGRLVKLEPRVFDVLLHLLHHRERVVSKAELLDALWAGTQVSESVLPRCISAARRAVGDERARGRIIGTVHGRGYRFVAEAKRVEAEAPAPSEGGGRPGFVGREAALQALGAALDACSAGQSRVVLLLGEPGIGKSRTLEEFARRAGRDGVRWLAGRCWEAEGAPPFWPFVQALRALETRASERARGDEGAVFDGVGAAGGEQARFRWFDAVARELRRAAERTPLLLSIDDLHWADEDALRLFAFLARELRDARLLLVGTYRDVEVRRGHALARVLGDLAHEPHVVRVTLRGLSAAETTALAEGIVGEALRPALARALEELTEGNPFFAQEMARWLRESGEVASTRAPALALPQGVRDAVGRRLDALPSEANMLLRAAAVIGREFPAALLAEVSGVERPLDALSQAAGVGVVEADVELPGRFRFSHALVRQTLYEELPVAERVRLHRRVAESLARGGASSAAERAYHLFEALPGGAAEEAAAACVAAAEEAHERLAYAESARQYERALEAHAQAEPNEARRAELLIALGEERWTDGDREGGRPPLAEAAELAERIGRHDLFARAAIAYRGFGELGMPPDAKTIGLLEKAREVTGDEHPLLRSRILARLAGTPPYSVSMAEREVLAREAWSLAAGSDDRAALVDAIGARYWATLGPDRLAERLAVSRDAHALASRYGDKRLELLGYEIAIGYHLMVGDVAAADRAIEAYDRGADEVRQPVFRFLAGLIRGSRALCSGDFEAGETWIREAVARGRGTIPYASSVFEGQVLVLLFLRGEHERVAEIAGALDGELARRFSGTRVVSEALAVIGQLHAGRVDAARKRYESLAARDFNELEHDEHWLTTVDVLADLVVGFGDQRRGEILYQALLPYRALLISHDLLRVVTETAEGVLGQLALLGDRVDDALAHYERARERSEALGLVPALGLAKLGLARSWLRRGASADRARAERLLAEIAAGPPGAARRDAQNVIVSGTSRAEANLKKSSTRPRDRKPSG
jgi:DNA-binding winged helix-turn-helix (wHTH) protein